MRLKGLIQLVIGFSANRDSAETHAMRLYKSTGLRSVRDAAPALLSAEILWETGYSCQTYSWVARLLALRPHFHPAYSATPRSPLS